MKTTSKFRRKKPATFLKWLQRAFLLIGLVCLGYYAYSQTEMFMFQSYENWRLDQIQQGKPNSILDYAESWMPGLASEPENAKSGKPSRSRGAPQSANSPESANSEGHSFSGSAERAPEGSLIGRIEIPRLALRAVVLEGIDSDTLRLAVGHLPGTPLPGDRGNVDLAAHRDTFFRGLRKIHDGDLVSVSTTSGELYRYRVDSIAVVSPDNGQFLNETPGPGLNLITCYPFNYVGAAPKRFVVHAEEVSETAEAFAPPIRRVRHVRRRATPGGEGGGNLRETSYNKQTPVATGRKQDPPKRSARLMPVSSNESMFGSDSADQGDSVSTRKVSVVSDPPDPPQTKAGSSSKFSGVRKFIHKVFRGRNAN